jgi:hypothetical protein
MSPTSQLRGGRSAMREVVMVSYVAPSLAFVAIFDRLFVVP